MDLAQLMRTHVLGVAPPQLTCAPALTATSGSGILRNRLSIAPRRLHQDTPARMESSPRKRPFTKPRLASRLDWTACAKRRCISFPPASVSSLNEYGNLRSAPSRTPLPDLEIKPCSLIRSRTLPSQISKCSNPPYQLFPHQDYLSASDVVKPPPPSCDLCCSAASCLTIKSLFSIVTLFVIWFTLYTPTKRDASSNMLFRREITIN